ncbi:hypothetical protein [Melittangium boletus]|uniref:hypothetical protein n=1 Tax=Melittangium boletus TaxID=83453 RepID=UPI003DA4735D
MGLSIQTNVPNARWQQQTPAVEHTRPAQEPRTEDLAPTEQPNALQHERMRDTFTASPDTTGVDANQGVGDARSVAQPTDTTCGKATVASVFGATQPGASDEQLLAEVDRAVESSNNNPTLRDQGVVDLNEDATAREMAVLMGQGGKEIVRGFGNYDTDAMDAAISQGQFGMALVDSSALPGQQGTGEKGSLHWLTIDKVEKGQGPHAADDRYRVKDPVNGEYWMGKAELENAVNKAQGEHGTGGMLVVKDRPDVRTQEARDALALKNLDHTPALGGDGGIGIRRGSSSESSYF